MAASITAASSFTTVSSDTTTASSPISRSLGLASLTGAQNYYGSYPDDYSNNDGEPGYDDQYFDESSVPTLSELARRANYGTDQGTVKVAKRD